MVYFTPGCPSRTHERRSCCLNSRLRTKASRGSLDFPKQTSASSVSGLARSAALFRADQKRRTAAKTPRGERNESQRTAESCFAGVTSLPASPARSRARTNGPDSGFNAVGRFVLIVPPLSAKGSLLPFHCLTTSCQHGPLRRMTLYSSGHFSLTAQRSLATWILF